MEDCFPVFIDIRKKRFVIFGAGTVAERRVRGLLRHGAAVTVVAPVIEAGFLQLAKEYPGQLHLERRVYRTGELSDDGADFVLAATDDADVNAAVCRECRHKEIPVNNASDRGMCDFYFPALVEPEGQGLVIGVSGTDGDHRKVARVSAALREAFAAGDLTGEK